MTYRVKIKLCAMLLLFEPIANAIAIANTLHWQRKKNHRCCYLPVAHNILLCSYHVLTSSVHYQSTDIVKWSLFVK